MIKASRGRYTAKQIERCSKLSGGFGKEVDHLFQTALRGGEDSSATTRYHRGQFHRKYDKDIESFVEGYQVHKLVEFGANRQPSLLPKIGDSTIYAPYAVGKDIKKKCKDLDDWLRVGDETRKRHPRPRN